MKILGLNVGHNSSAALLENGLIQAASEEERFNREKHSKAFPINAIKFCLNKCSTSINEIDEITIGMDLMKRAKSRFDFRFMESCPEIAKQAAEGALGDINKRIGVEEALRKKLGYNGKITFLDHHDCHAAACYFPAEFNSAGILTIDGAGEKATTRIYHAKNSKIKKLLQIDFPDSMGLFYSLITNHLGFKIDSGEGKVMGLSSYGDDSLVDEMKKIVIIRKDKTYKLNKDYFNFSDTNINDFSNKFIKIFGEKREKGEKITKKHENIAKAAQVVLEEVLFNLIKLTKELTGEDNLCLGGGVVLNSVVNGKIVASKMFSDIYIYPASGDNGVAVGGAFHSYYLTEEDKIFYKENQCPYLGYEASEKEVIEALNEYNLKFSKPKNIYQETARLIVDNKILGWFSGRAEFGPRALGNRSILADPRNPKSKDILNAKIKFRESFRPFAPTILEEFADDYFETYGALSPYMLLVFDVKQNKKSKVPSIVHIDDTARVQTINKIQNSRYWNLINEFYKISGVPVVLNTSFNRAGEPIVNTPKQAIEVFLGSGLDGIVIGDYIILK